LTLWTPLKAADDFDCCLVCDILRHFQYREYSFTVVSGGRKRGRCV